MDALLLEIIAHLGDAKSQTLPSDDQIIAGHVIAVLAIATAARKALRECPTLIPAHIQEAA